MPNRTKEIFSICINALENNKFINISDSSERAPGQNFP